MTSLALVLLPGVLGMGFVRLVLKQLLALSVAARTSEFTKVAQPVAQVLKARLEDLFGTPLGKVGVSLDACVLFAVLVALVGIWREAARANELAVEGRGDDSDSDKKKSKKA